MTNKIEVGDTIITCNGRVEAKVLEINSWGKATLQYPNSIQAQSVSNLRLIKKGQKSVAQKLYTIHGGTVPHELLCKSGDYAWVRQIPGNGCAYIPTTVRYSSLKEIIPEKFVYCEIVGTIMCVWKRCEANNLPNAGDYFLTESCNVLRVLSVQEGIPDYSPGHQTDPSKIPTLKGKKIKFV